MSVEPLVIAVIAAPIIMQFLKALGLDTELPIIPFLAAGIGFLITLGGSWLMDDTITKATVVLAIVGAFGPGGFYELVVKKVPVVGSAGKS